MHAPFPDPPATLPAALERAAVHFPNRGVAVFDARGRRHERRLYPEILAGARLAAGRWAALGVAPGDPLLICLPTSWAWLDSWLGAVLLGALPVAVAPLGGLGGAESQVRKVNGIRRRLSARYVLTGAGFAERALELEGRDAAAAAITPEALAQTAPAGARAPTLTADDIAFLQLTSGSTGASRAVRIPHRAAIHNPLASDAAIGSPHGAPVHEWAESMVSWLPLHHDMGLVGCLLLSICCGFDLWLLQPTTFLARPRSWLDELGKHGRVISPAPNFGYQLCVERGAASESNSLDNLDLSRWSDAMTGAEMIRPETVRSFCETYAAVGFRPEAFRPCYGLAEGTLAITFDLAGRGLRTRPLPEGAGPEFGLSEVACVGRPIADTELRIVGPNGQALPEGRIGEVRARGPSVFAGYHDDPEATAESLIDGWLATGDLGFLEDGELYLTGRSKDVLIVRGHNLMPHELEWLAEGVVGGGGALRAGAFTVARGARGEEAVLVVETGETEPAARAALERGIRQAIGRALSLTLADVVFVRRGRIPKTTSGKVQRRELRARYLAGEIDLA